MNTKKKITLFATTDLNFDQRLQRISNTLQKNNFEVLLVGRKLKKSPNLSKEPYKQKRLKCIFNKGILFYLEFNIRIFFFILKNHSDIVTANDLDTVLGVYLASKVTQRKLVFDAHEYFTEVPELKGKKHKKRIWKKIEKTCLDTFDKYYTVNQSLANIFMKNLQLDFKVIRNLSLNAKNKVKKSNKGQYILYQGALNKGRGLKELISAMINIDLHLKIAGDGDIEKELFSYVKELELENKIEFLGKLEPKELQKITNRAFIGVNLLENTSLNYYYSLANKFFDYMQAEVPQICMNFPEYKAINKEDEVTVLIKNLEKNTIVKAIKSLQNDTFYKRLKSNCKNAKTKYIWENEEIEIVKLYNSL